MKALKIIGIVLLVILLVAGGVFIYMNLKWSREANKNLSLLGEQAPTLVLDGVEFRDLNKNGELDPYEDYRVSVEERVEDLLGQMNLGEKAGLMFINMIVIKPGGELLEKPIPSNPLSFMLPSNSEYIARLKMNHFNIIDTLSPSDIAKWHNKIQKLAERTRLGIPATIASDPRHSAGMNPGSNLFTRAYSHWPSTLGLAATRDTSLVREFGDIARQEYLATGFRLALHPMADIATEPRWGRFNGTFGEDAQLVADMTKSYILGFQGDSLTSQSVACMVKHFSGAGPQEDGEDAHFQYGKNQVYPGDNFDYHLIPFERGAFPANVAQVMPYYAIPVGQTNENVAFAFNKEVITDMLRGKYGFDGVVCTDWAIISEGTMVGARPWGVEDLTEEERVAKAIGAGCDMFGGESRPELIISNVEKGMISEARLDESVRRILRDKFLLGLFDAPYVDEAAISGVLRRDDFVEKGKEAQRRSVTLLKNVDDILPLTLDTKVYFDGFGTIDPHFTDNVVATKEEADVVVVKRRTPFEERSDYFLERFFRQGRLWYSDEEKQEILDLMKGKRSVFILSLDRPTVFPEIDAKADAVIADFDCSDQILVEALFGAFEPTGKLPFEIPSSKEAVEAQYEDLPYDSKNPLYNYGHGLGYGLEISTDNE